LHALHDRLLNRYKLPDNPRSAWTRAGRLARNLNILRMLGGMTMSAFPDLARPLYRHGFARYAKSLSLLVTSPSFRKMAFADMKHMGVATEMVLHGRLRSISELDYAPLRTSKFEAYMDKLVSGNPGGIDFGKLSLMSPWNASVKALTGIMAQDGLIAHLAKNEKYAKKLAQHGIPPEMVGRMKEQLAKHGKSESGLKMANSDLWDDLEAAELFEATILREVDQTIVTPGIMDKPLWTSSEIGKVISQFKSFGFAATNKQLLAGMAHFDGKVMMGMLSSIALGALTYSLKQRLAGKDPATFDEEPEKLLMNAIEYSGVIGMGSEAVQFGANAARMAGVYKGEGNPIWAKESLMQSGFGPSLDLGVNTFRAGRSFTDDANAGDIHAVRSIIPYNNLFYIRPIFDAAEEAARDYKHIVE
jgi:hypothetical protein